MFKNLNDLMKLIVAIGFVTIGISNFILFPLIDVIFPSAHILKNELPVLQAFGNILKP